ncbi:hypothetical protein MKW94_023474 [Papaver nudicaule]|uniref:Uncharacterized protein n=1 Tax=Papaver nudicaule TaxID=74823 RepID=A0AA41SJE9_PAPNU|nr:hypothetical protein [Papaver nudicaule]
MGKSSSSTVNSLKSAIVVFAREAMDKSDPSHDPDQEDEDKIPKSISDEEKEDVAVDLSHLK